MVEDVILDFSDSDQVYVSISKEETEKFFKDARVTPKNEYGKEDETYTGGEIQFIFEKDGDKIQEILIFPVYSNDQGSSNGSSFIDAPDSVWENTNLLNAVRAELKKARS